jgi:hypothetical protein
MSTTFGIEIPSLFDENELEIVEVAFRSSFVRWKSAIARALPDDTPVIPLDNSAQGIYTIGDIRKEVNGANAT